MNVRYNLLSNKLIKIRIRHRPNYLIFSFAFNDGSEEVTAYFLPGLTANTVSNNKDDCNDEEDMMFLSVFLMILVFIYSCPTQLSLETSLL